MTTRKQTYDISEETIKLIGELQAVKANEYGVKKVSKGHVVEVAIRALHKALVTDVN